MDNVARCSDFLFLFWFHFSIKEIYFDLLKNEVSQLMYLFSLALQWNFRTGCKCAPFW